MATRSIVTSQPDVECDVCERRLLRGEQPDVFLDAGQPRMVCELCAPRAAHQGWKRGSEQHLLESAEAPSRRGRGLLGRLRQARRAELRGSLALDAFDESAEEPLRPYDVHDDGGVAGATAGDARGRVAPVRAGAVAPAAIEPRSAGEDALQRALDVFNASEYTRRVASLARSLGEPEVTVRAGEAVASCVVVVLAWELCWYAYEIDLDDMQGVEVRAIAQGTELDELGAGDRLANARADARGALALA